LRVEQANWFASTFDDSTVDEFLMINPTTIRLAFTGGTAWGLPLGYPLGQAFSPIALVYGGNFDTRSRPIAVRNFRKEMTKAFSVTKKLIQNGIKRLTLIVGVRSSAYACTRSMNV
jgi:hypothetical protein